MRPWTRADDRASKYISARPYEHDIDCEATWNFARSCFYACKEKHGRCRGRLTESFDTQWRRSRADLDGESVAIDDVPSRLLDVHPEDEPKVKMVEVHDMTDAEKALVCSLGFAALSYCWGGQQSLVLTKEQDRHLRGGLAISRLPKTIQDAIKTVRKLRLRYLWVDALCIYQDDDQDKAAEISRMETYYGSAAVTICAAIASSSEQGFLFRRESTPFGVGPIRVPLVNEEGINQGHLYLLKEAEAPPEPTTTRGWTMQESLLSRRILIYAARQLYWCCNTSIAGCGGEHMEFLDKISGNLYSLVDNIHPIGSIIEQPIAGQWDYLVMDYTARHLGVPGDKLLAVSALVSHLLELAKERGQKFVYAAGLLIDMENDNSWANQLQWHTLDPQRSRRVSSYRAPSWSWAAVDGPISPNEDLVILGRGNMARVESHAVDVVYQHLPFGSVRGGYVVVQKKKRRISECTGFPGLPLVIRGTRLADYQGRDGARSRMELLPDTEEDCKRIDDLISEGAREKGQIFLLLLQSNKLVRGSKGLIVSPAGMDNMARIGLFLVHQRDSSATFDASTIFRDCPVGSVRLNFPSFNLINMAGIERVFTLTSTAEARAAYDDWAEDYNDEMLGTTQDYVAPALASEYMVKYLAPRNIADVAILDAGCGTGLVGVNLAKQGAQTVDGIDLSEGMLQVARRTGVYRSLDVADLSQPLSQASRSYDAVVCVGTMTQGHVGPEAFDEFARVVKPGGLIIATVRETVWEKNGVWAYINFLLDPFKYFADQAPNPITREAFTPQAEALTWQMANVILLLAPIALICCWTKNREIAIWYLVAVGLGDWGHIYAVYRGVGPEYFWDFAGWNDMTAGNVGVSAFLNVNRWLTVAGVFGSVGSGHIKTA
ncbi:hypothetical protein ACJ41O_010546 [Fusarium nematophilum]